MGKRGCEIILRFFMAFSAPGIIFLPLCLHAETLSDSVHTPTRFCRFPLRWRKGQPLVHEAALYILYFRGEEKHNLWSYMTFAPQIFLIYQSLRLHLSRPNFVLLFHRVHYRVFCFNRDSPFDRLSPRQHEHCIHNAIIDFAVSAKHTSRRRAMYTFKVFRYFSAEIKINEIRLFCLRNFHVSPIGGFCDEGVDGLTRRHQILIIVAFSSTLEDFQLDDAHRTVKPHGKKIISSFGKYLSRFRGKNAKFMLLGRKKRSEKNRCANI